VTFIFPYLTWAFEPDAYHSLTPANSLSIQFRGKSIVFPAKLGVIEKAFQGQNKLIIHIQDLHCNEEVQKNIAGMVHLLAKDHGLKLVGQEGAFHTLDISPIRRFPIPEIREAVSNYYLRQGKLTGAEYYGGTGEYPIKLEGIETPKLYEESLQTIRTFLNSESQGYCLDIRGMLDALKPGIYNQDLLALDQNRTTYRDGSLDVLAYAARLRKSAGRFGINPTQFPRFQKYLSRKAFGQEIEPELLFQE